MNFEKLEKYLDSIVSEKKAPGVDCIVYQNHKPIFRHMSGVSNIEENKKIDGNELYLIFSMTKMLTCTTALILYEQGKYSFEDEISKYLPEFSQMKIADCEMGGNCDSAITSGKAVEKSTGTTSEKYAKKKIRVVDLFTMGAGLDYDINSESIKKAREENKTTTRDMVRAISEKTLLFEPGERFKYSLCHDVLGALIEVWSGLTLGECMKKYIFDPLGMKNTFFGVPKDEERLSKMAMVYGRDENGEIVHRPLTCIYTLGEGYESGGAGLTSCTEDYALFLDALACKGEGYNGYRLLKEETIELMRGDYQSPKQYEDFQQLRKGYSYALGVRVHKYPEISGSKSPVGEFGWDGALGAFSMVDTKNSLSLTYFQHMGCWEIETHEKMRNVLYECI